MSVMLTAASTANANLVLNGDFSSYTPYTISGGGLAAGFELDSVSGTANSLTDWTSAGYNFLFLPGTNAAGGSYSPQYKNYMALWSSTNGGSNTWNNQGPTSTLNFVASDPAYQTGALTQSISGLTAGQNYILTFQWAAGQQTAHTGATTEGWQVTLGSQTLSTITVNNASQGFVPWMMATMTFTASASTEALSFLATGGPTGVPPFALLSNVNLTAAPEPVSLSILAVGVAGALVARRRRVKA